MKNDGSHEILMELFIGIRQQCMVALFEMIKDNGLKGLPRT